MTKILPIMQDGYFLQFLSLLTNSSYNGLFGEALPERGKSFRLQVFKRVGISLVEVFERVQKSVISVCEKDQIERLRL